MFFKKKLNSLYKEVLILLAIELVLMATILCGVLAIWPGDMLLTPTSIEDRIFFEDVIIFTHYEFEVTMISLWLIHIIMWVPFGFVMGVSWERDGKEK